MLYNAHRVCSPLFASLPQLSTGSLQAPVATPAGGGSGAEEVARQGSIEHVQQLRAEQAPPWTSTDPQLGRVSLLGSVLNVPTRASFYGPDTVRQRSR